MAAANVVVERELVRAYGSTLMLALVPIVLGSFSSLKLSKPAKRRLRRAARRRKRRGASTTTVGAAALIAADDNDEEEDDDEEREEEDSSSSSSDASTDADEEEEEDSIERITATDAWLFPLVGSAMLGSLWLVFKYIDTVWINRLFKGYFALAGVLSLYTTTSSLVDFLTPSRLARALPELNVAIKDRGEDLLTLTLPFLSLVIALPLALALPTLYLLSAVVPLPLLSSFAPNWLPNTLALSLASSAISLLALDSFPTAFLLLAGLLLYDVGWVFASPVMVDVASRLEAPVKLVVSKGGSAIKGETMLGLGDIIIPGIVLALALRLDYSLASRLVLAPASSSTPSRRRRRLPPVLLPSSAFPKPYFQTALAGYILGLATTMAVMHRFRTAQPALLYLGPSVAGSVLLVAWLKGELALLWSWTDGSDDEDDSEKKEEKVERRRRRRALREEAKASRSGDGDIGGRSTTTTTTAVNDAAGGRVKAGGDGLGPENPASSGEEATTTPEGSVLIVEESTLDDDDIPDGDGDDDRIDDRPRSRSTTTARVQVDTPRRAGLRSRAKP